jgi:hypothetical protein
MKGSYHGRSAARFPFVGDIGSSGSFGDGGLRADGDASSGVKRQQCSKRRINPGFLRHMESPNWPGFEPPASGPGPVTNRLRLRGGPQRGVSDPRQLVGDYTNPILKSDGAEVVKKHGDIELRGVGFFYADQPVLAGAFIRGNFARCA